MPRKKTEKEGEEKKNPLEIEVFNTKGEVVEKLVLPKEIFAAKINESLMAQAVRVYLANQRQGTASTKTRGEVAGSGRKIWRQKGTGRARHGDRYAPIFVGGGIAFGPKMRDYSLKMPKKMRRAALFSSLTSKFEEKAIFVIADLNNLKPKTKEMVKIRENLKLKSKTLLILPKKKENIILAGRNIPELSLISADLLNTYEVLNHRKLLFTKEAIEILKKTFLKEVRLSKKKDYGNK